MGLAYPGITSYNNKKNTNNNNYNKKLERNFDGKVIPMKKESGHSQSLIVSLLSYTQRKL
jgi:hypothetical protein